MIKTSRKKRLQLAIAGCSLISAGLLRELSGVHVVTWWTGGPMFSWGVIAAGIVLLVFSFVPDNLAERFIRRSQR